MTMMGAGTLRESIPIGLTRSYSPLTVAGLPRRPSTKGELFPAQFREGGSGPTFLEFFQIDKETGDAKGIVVVELRELP